MAGTIKVLIVHDGPLLGQGLRMLLSADPQIEVVGEAASERAALALAEMLQPQVALIDIDMRYAGGLVAAKTLAAHCPQVALLMLSLHDDEETRARARQAGAARFISKQLPGQVLDEIHGMRRMT